MEQSENSYQMLPAGWENEKSEEQKVEYLWYHVEVRIGILERQREELRYCQEAYLDEIGAVTQDIPKSEKVVYAAQKLMSINLATKNIKYKHRNTKWNRSNSSTYKIAYLKDVARVLDSDLDLIKEQISFWCNMLMGYTEETVDFGGYGPEKSACLMRFIFYFN